MVAHVYTWHYKDNSIIASECHLHTLYRWAKIF